MRVTRTAHGTARLFFLHVLGADRRSTWPPWRIIGCLIRIKHRFIPARAGDSETKAAGKPATTIHPRPAPRARDRLIRSRRRRVIHPACAGNSRRRGARNAPAPVHPRVCWEQSISRLISRAISGSCSIRCSKMASIAVSVRTSIRVSPWVVSQLHGISGWAASVGACPGRGAQRPRKPNFQTLGTVPQIRAKCLEEDANAASRSGFLEGAIWGVGWFHGGKTSLTLFRIARDLQESCVWGGTMLMEMEAASHDDQKGLLDQLQAGLRADRDAQERWLENSSQPFDSVALDLAARSGSISDDRGPPPGNFHHIRDTVVRTMAPFRGGR